MVVSEEGIVIRMKSGDVSKLGRSTQGVKVMNVAEDDRVMAVARMKVDDTTITKKKDADQAALDLFAAGEQDGEGDAVDIGGDEQVIDVDVNE